MSTINYRDLNAPQLVRYWKKIVNDNVMMGRDAHLIKDFLLRGNSVQILLGMYRRASLRTLTIPMFLRQHEEWFEYDESLAEIELARHISHTTPPEYYTYIDLVGEETSFAFQKSLEARITLREWANKVLA